MEEWQVQEEGLPEGRKRRNSENLRIQNWGNRPASVEKICIRVYGTIDLSGLTKGKDLIQKQHDLAPKFKSNITFYARQKLLVFEIIGKALFLFDIQRDALSST